MTDAASTEAHISLDIADAHGSLRELWASEALRDLPVVRAQTHNVVICRAGGEASVIDEPLIELALAHPGRAIVIDAGEGAPRLEGSASVYCRSEGGKQVCGELIMLRTRGSAREDVHSLVVSLLLPDLPVYVWWQGQPPSADHLFDEIVSQADQVFFDSDSFDDPTGGLAALAGLSGFAVGDLNWTRLTAWRQLMARLFDVAELRDELEMLHSIDVHYVANVEPYNPNRALLLVGWLAARLGWSLEEGATGKTGGYIFRFKAKQQLIKVEVVEGHASHLNKGELTGVFIVAGRHAPYEMPRVVLGEEADSLEMRVAGSLEATKDAPIHAMPYSVRHPALLLAEALALGRDPDYASALEEAGVLLAAAGASD